MRRVKGVVCLDTDTDITWLLNQAADVWQFDPVGLLGGIIAESGLKEQATRKRAWPDWSAGLGQFTLKWWGKRVPGVTLAPDGTAQPTEENWQRFCRYFNDAERTLAVLAPHYHRLLQQWGTPLEAWCRHNRPSTGLTPEHSNYQNYVRSLKAAEEYAERETYMVAGVIVRDRRGQLPTLASSNYATKAYPRGSLADIEALTYHYTAGSYNATTRDVASYQTGPQAIPQTGEDQPFPAIAYTYVIPADGSVDICHDLDVVTWHAPGWNRKSRAICFIGNGRPTAAQIRGIAYAHFLAEQELGRPVPGRGHKDGYSTTCPGPQWPSWKHEVDAVLAQFRASASVYTPTPPNPLATSALEYFSNLRGVLVVDLRQQWAEELDTEILQPLRRGDVAAAEQYASRLTDYLGADLPNRFQTLGQQVQEWRDRLRGQVA